MNIRFDPKGVLFRSLVLVKEGKIDFDCFPGLAGLSQIHASDKIVVFFCFGIIYHMYFCFAIEEQMLDIILKMTVVENTYGIITYHLKI